MNIIRHFKKWKIRLYQFLILGIVCWLIFKLGYTQFKVCRCSENYFSLCNFKTLLQQVTKDASCMDKQLAAILNVNLNLPTIYLVTPTYARPVQKAELTRLSHTLRLVPNIHWIVIEDSEQRNNVIAKLLKKSQVPYTHLSSSTPSSFKMKQSDPSWLKPKGVLQRNAALDWLRQNLNEDTKGVLYFADDDNTYDLEIFEEMRLTKKVSVWPVGLVGGLFVEHPFIKNGKVIGWNTLWKKERTFPIDMAGFAINVQLLLKNPEAKFTLKVPRGYQETHLLKQMVTVDELEPLASNCTKVLVWHTRTETPKLKQERKNKIPSNYGIEV